MSKHPRHQLELRNVSLITSDDVLPGEANQLVPESPSYLDELANALQQLRNIEGFPDASNESILGISRPPSYTACPNPFVQDFVMRAFSQYDESSDSYHREPFSTDVSEGRNDPVYNAHTYHTKVPHKAIMHYILHYTEPGDLIYDGFCGTGMTGVAAHQCGSESAVRSLGYRVSETGEIANGSGNVVSRLGPRIAILNDLSPIATFIAGVYSSPIDIERFATTAHSLLDSLEEQCGWMYRTLHNPTDEELQRSVSRFAEASKGDAYWSEFSFGEVLKTIWSDVFLCPSCEGDIVFWEAAVDHQSGKVVEPFSCPTCSVRVSKKDCDHSWESFVDSTLRQPLRQIKTVPVLIEYQYGKKRFTKRPDRFDLMLLHAIASQSITQWHPSDRMPEGSETRRNDRIGLTHTHHFHFSRTIRLLAVFHERIVDDALLRMLFNSQLVNLSKLNRYRPSVSFPFNPLSGTLYIGSQTVEVNPIKAYRNKIGRFSAAFAFTGGNNLITTQSATTSAIPSNSLDYIFVDPPFGGNLMYSELNVLWECWLRVFTNNDLEAVESSSQRKGLPEYQALMTECFCDFYRCLKPGRWMTVEFHNSKNSVWNAIQEGLQRAGFVVADVRTLDKQGEGTFKQLTGAGAVKQDLVISAYKPRSKFVEAFRRQAGTADAAWEFVRQHLEQVPVLVEIDGRFQAVAERQAFLLYDRMIAFHLVCGATIPLSSAEFYTGLRHRFLERDGMFFLPNQAAEFDQMRMAVESIEQLTLFVSDESAAIRWLHLYLADGAKTYQEIHPAFLKQLSQSRYERLPELTHILEQNFLRDDSDRWYVPDPQRQVDLERLRERELLAVFSGYIAGKGKLREFRSEAVRAGIKHCWQNREYRTIVDVTNRLPVSVLQEDPQLLMYYDIASARID